MKVGVLLLALGLVPLVAGACGAGDDGEAATGPVVVVTVSILGDVTGNVVGDDATVEVLIPLGVDPHGFEPSPQDVGRIQDADLVVANGLGLEQSLEGVLGDAEEDGTPVVEVASEVDPIEADPHFWTDPLRVAEAAEVIAGALAGVDDSVDWGARAQRYAEEVRAAHGEIEDILAAVPDARRKLVTNHEVFGYFAARYDFEVLGALVPGGSTLAEPSAAELADLADLVRDEGVPAVFAETTQPTRLADALGAEAGSEVEVVELFTESLGEPGSEADTYLGMMLENARRIAGALG